MAWNIRIEKIKESKISSVDWNNVPFGKVFSDHMFIADYEDGKWQNPRIIPFDKIPMSPAFSGIHYGQSIFEGMKAQRDNSGNITLFRPDLNAKRMNISAERMALPTIDEEEFIHALVELVKIEEQWIPSKENYTLYLRPVMFGNDQSIGVKPPDTAMFIIMCCPVGPYYTTPLNVKIAEKYVRAVPGGAGFAKAAGNYGATLMPVKEIKAEGYDQYLWTDVFEHKYIQEVGTMNIFFVIDGEVHTPALDGTLLDGTTRNTLIQLFKDNGIAVHERKISVDELYEAHKFGLLNECFGSGTAAVISQVQKLSSSKGDILLNVDLENGLAVTIKRELLQLRAGLLPDKHNWVLRLNAQPASIGL